MWKYRQNFVENDQRKCINIGANGDFIGDHIKVLYMEPDWNFQDFLKASSQRLNIAPLATRAFTVDGVEIDDCLMVEDNDILFLSNNGEDFIMPSDTNHQLTESNSENKRDEIAIVHGYKVSNLLGKGGFGEVRLGEHTVTAEKVALKFLRKSDILTIGAAERTVTEIQCLATLKHQHIIKLLHHTESVQHVILVFELMEGGDLMKYLCKRGDTPQEISLSEEESRSIFHQITSGVSYAHNQHICHRDLKLENILLKGPNTVLVKIADFGLSDFYRPGSTMRSNCGTLSFLSPEVFRGTANAGPPLDVWALGVILFAILCGRLPFEDICLSNRKRPRDTVVKARILKGQYKIDETLSTEVKDLLRRMMKINPEERASIPEILSHCWMRQLQTIWSSDSNKVNSSASSRPRGGSQSILTRSESSKTALTAKSSSSSNIVESNLNNQLRPSSAVQEMNDDSLNILLSAGQAPPKSPSNRSFRSVSFDGEDHVGSESLTKLQIISQTNSSFGRKLQKDSDQISNSEHSSSAILTSGRSSFVPTLPCLPQEPSTPITDALCLSSLVPSTHYSNPTINQGSGQLLQSAGLDVISSFRIPDEETPRLPNVQSPPQTVQSSRHSPPTTAALLESITDELPLLQCHTESGSMDNVDVARPLSSSYQTTASVANMTSATPLKLIPLRRDRSMSRSTEDYQNNYLIKMEEFDSKSFVHTDDISSLSKSLLKCGKDDSVSTINDSEDTNNRNSFNSKNGNGLSVAPSNKETTLVSKQLQSIKNFQRSTISSSQQANPTLSRFSERDRSYKSTSLGFTAPSSSSTSQYSLQASSTNHDNGSISPSLSPGSSPRKIARKDVNGSEIPIIDDNDYDSLAPTGNSGIRGMRTTRNSRRNSFNNSSFHTNKVQNSNNRKDSSMTASQVIEKVIKYP